MNMKALLLSAALSAFVTLPPAEAASSKRVVFESGGERLVGDLYLPDGYREGDRLPGIVVTGAWTTVKEQMPARYAAELANRGYAALAFDFTGWGQSEGRQRQLESPAVKTADIVAAARFLAKRPEIDPARIGGLGICASAGYMADAVARSSELRSLALVAPWLHDREIVHTVYGGADGVAGLIAASREAQARYERSGELVMVPAASTTDKTAIMQQAPYYTDRSRGLIPEYVNQFNIASWEPWLTYDGIKVAAEIKDPVTIVHSDAAAVPQGARKFYAALTAPKSELWLDKVAHFDFYDQDEPVRRASDAIAAHFAKTLD
jgi:fermentation-respiration switch protein FrsA (DUF1100 family)